MKNLKTNLLKGALLLSAILVFSTGITAEAKAKPKLSSKKITITVGQKKKLKVKNFKKKKKIKWSSKNNKIATVNKKGKVVGKKKGKTTIIAKVGNKKLKCKVVVKKAKSKKSSDKKTNTNKKTNTKISETLKKELPSAKQYRNFNYPETVAVGKTVDLFDYVYYAARPINAPSNSVKVKAYKWISSDSSIISIDKYGVATVHKEGKVKIYFQYLDRSGEWRESNPGTIRVINAGDVSYTVSYGLNRDWVNLENPYNVRDMNEPGAFNYVNVTVTNNSDTEVVISNEFGLQFGGWYYWSTRDNQSVTIPAKTSKTILYRRTEYGGVRAQSDIYRTCLLYSIHNKDTGIYYYPKKGIYEVWQNKN